MQNISNLKNHPCFNEQAHFEYGRLHLPVAPNCNIQCNFCNRRFDCVNESRPGVTSVVLGPYQAAAYLEKVLQGNKKISVVGIAGPGEPFSEPELTLKTLSLVRDSFPDIKLCVASNGLNVLPFIEELIKLRVSHMTITVNAVTPEIGAKIYSWVRYQKKIYRNAEAAGILNYLQIETIRELKRRGITVKVNTIIIPGINDTHIIEIAKKCANLGVDILNCIPICPSEGTLFENIREPDSEFVTKIRKQAEPFIKQIYHCRRCRADAVGLLGKELDKEALLLLQQSAALPLNPKEERPFVAVASREGVLVNLHLGEAEQVYVYKKENNGYLLVEIRNAPAKGGGELRWMELADVLRDCKAILVGKAGLSPKEALNKSGIKVIEMQGLIEEGLKVVFDGQPLPSYLNPLACNCALSQKADGCGCNERRQDCG